MSGTVVLVLLAAAAAWIVLDAAQPKVVPCTHGILSPSFCSWCR